MGSCSYYSSRFEIGLKGKFLGLYNGVGEVGMGVWGVGVCWLDLGFYYIGKMDVVEVRGFIGESFL